MLKYLLLIVLALIVWWSWRSARQPQTPPAAGSEHTVPENAPEDMVACARCGVYLPAKEALPGPQGRHFCSERHRDA